MDDEEEDDKKKKYPNMLDLLFYFEQTGVGLPRHEMVLLNLSIRKLVSTMPLENIRYSICIAYITFLNYIIPLHVYLVNVYFSVVDILDFGVKFLGNLKIITY